MIAVGGQQQRLQYPCWKLDQATTSENPICIRIKTVLPRTGGTALGQPGFSRSRLSAL